MSSKKTKKRARQNLEEISELNGFGQKLEKKKQELKENLEKRLKGLDERILNFAVSTEAELNSENPPFTLEEYKKMVNAEGNVASLLYMAGYLYGMYKPWSKLPKWLKYSSYPIMLDNMVRSLPGPLNVMRPKPKGFALQGFPKTDDEPKPNLMGYPGVIGKGREFNGYLCRKFPKCAEIEGKLADAVNGYIRKGTPKAGGEK